MHIGRVLSVEHHSTHQGTIFRKLRTLNPHKVKSYYPSMSMATQDPYYFICNFPLIVSLQLDTRFMNIVLVAYAIPKSLVVIIFIFDAIPKLSIVLWNCESTTQLLPCFTPSVIESMVMVYGVGMRIFVALLPP